MRSNAEVLIAKPRPWSVRRHILTAALTVLIVLAGQLHAGIAAADDPPPPADRTQVLGAWQYGGAQVRSAAERALVGTDDDVGAFLAGGWQRAEAQDERDAVVAVIGDGGPTVRAAANQSLAAADAGDTSALSDFIADGWRQASDTDARVQVNQLLAAGGDQVKQAAQQSLDSDDPTVWREFVDSGWQSRWTVDQRVRVNQAIAAGGPEVQAAGQKALDAGTPEALESFLDTGWDVAAARDQETATLTGLLAQAQAQGDTAAQETQNAVDEAARASQAAAAARKSAEQAEQATQAAHDDAAQAREQAQRAAVAAQKAADAARVAVDAAAAAQRAARAAAGAAQRAAVAASKAEQAATDAYNHAAAAATDRSKAADARQTAVAADVAAILATDLAKVADAAGKAIQAGLDGLTAAQSAVSDANAASTASDNAVNYANQAGADASAATAAASRARADAQRAARAITAAHNYLLEAADAAFAARDAANRAAHDAQVAAQAANDAADHAGEAAGAAQRASDAATAATNAAQAAVDTAEQAIQVYDAARAADTERIAVAEGDGIAQAQQAAAQYDAAQQAAQWDATQAQQRDAETNQLIAEAQNPATDPATAVVDGRKIALSLAQASGSFTQQAALAALVGSDADVLVYVTSGLPAAAGQDDRVAVTNIAVTSNTALRDAALAALGGSDATVAQFLQTQNYPGRTVQDRIKVNQILAAAQQAGDVVVQQKAQVALDDGTPAVLREFISAGQYTAATVGQRVQVDQILAAADSGPELQAAAQVALDGPPPALQQFLSVGRYTAAELDQDAAAHLAVVSSLIGQINETAQTAVQNALKAQAAAAQARNDAAAAANYANQAAQAAQTAAGYATQANAYADQASQAVDKAATAVQTAKAAATRADTSARDAIRSASWAVISHDNAVQDAQNAIAAAQRARDSATAAGADAKVAADAGGQAYNTFVHAQGLAIAECDTEYAEGPAPDIEKLLTGSEGNFYHDCVANAIGDPAELAKRAYTNAAYCSGYPSGSDLYNNCMASVLDPAFLGDQTLVLITGLINGLTAALIPVAGALALGCVITVVCGTVAGTLLTMSDVGLSIYKYINGDQSLSDTLLHLGTDALESLAFWGIGKLAGAGFGFAKELYTISRLGKEAETELKAVNRSSQELKLLANCLTGANSFTPETPVLLADRTSKPIAQITVGDRVLATDPSTGQTTGEPVTRLITSTDTDLTDLTVESGGSPPAPLHTTAHHLFFTPQGGRWTEAGQLTAGTVLHTPDGDDAQVAGVRTFAGSQTMYNLTVADLHTFYALAGNMPVLVHNSNCWSATDDVLDAIHDNYGPRVEQGVEYMMDRYNQGAVGHALNGVGTDATATARYLAQPRTWTHIDNTSGNWVTYDSSNQILIIRTAQNIHAYNYTTAQWATNVGVRYVEPAAGTVAPAWP